MNTLSVGSHGAAVVALQQDLTALGYSPGQIDGDFGGLTEAAVRAFKKAEGIIDGVADPGTLARLSARRKGCPKLRSPVLFGTPAPITSPFGPRGSDFHNGIDLGMPVGTALCALASGAICGLDGYGRGRSGRYLIVDLGGGWKFSFSHLSRLEALTVGARVEAGQRLGWSGGDPKDPGAGRSDGPHLHLVVSYQDQALDPAPLLDGR